MKLPLGLSSWWNQVNCSIRKLSSKLFVIGMIRLVQGSRLDFFDPLVCQSQKKCLISRHSDPSDDSDQLQGVDDKPPPLENEEVWFRNIST